MPRLFKVQVEEAGQGDGRVEMWLGVQPDVIGGHEEL